MSGMRVCGKRLGIGASRGRILSATRVGLPIALAVLVLALVPAVASAESLCTDTWVGPGEGTWQTAADWSLAAVPTSTDVACVGSGKTVKVTEGSDVAGDLQGLGAVKISGGSLELSNVLEPSTIGSFTLLGGSLTGAATLNVTGSFLWEGTSTISGSGSLVLSSGVSAGKIKAFNGSSESMTLDGRSFVNEGKVTFSSGSLYMTKGAELRNSGTFIANSSQKNAPGNAAIEPPSGSEGAAPSIVNTGKLTKTEGSPTRIDVAVENKGTVEPEQETIELIAGSSSPGGVWKPSPTALVVFAGSESSYSLKEGSISGAIKMAGGTMTMEGVSATSAHLTISGGTLTVAKTAMTVGELSVTGGSLTGVVTVTVIKTFLWEGTSTISGGGSLVLTSGVTAGQIKSFNESSESMTLDGRTLINEGTLTFGSGTLYMNKGAELRNSGTLAVNSQQTKAPGGAAIEPPSGAEGTAPSIVNTGTVKKKEGGGTTKIDVDVENKGTISAESGNIELIDGGSSAGGAWTAQSLVAIAFSGSGKSYSFNAGSIAGAINISQAAVTTEGVSGSSATVSVASGSLTIEKSAMTVSGVKVTGGSLGGGASLTVTSSFKWEGTSTVSGSGSLTLGSGVTSGDIKEFNSSSETMTLDGRALVNEGHVALQSGTLYMNKGAKIQNKATFVVNSEKENAPDGAAIEPPSTSEGAEPMIVNTGRITKNEGGTSKIGVTFENYGTVEAESGRHIQVLHPAEPALETQFGSLSAGVLERIRAFCGDPVDCVTGNYTETQTDMAVGGRGVGLELTRTYNAQAAAKATSAGMFGYGWASSFSDRLVVESSAHTATLYEANGSTLRFTESGGVFTAPARSGDTLTGSSEAGYTVTQANQTKHVFSGSNGRLESVEDRNGNKTTLGYNEKGQLVTITDPSGRKITLSYNAGGRVESAEDPMGHVVQYAYESENLTSVTLPGETSPNWRFKYDASHRMTAMTNGLGGETTNVYDSSNRVTSQKDPLGHTLKWEYESFQTKIKNEATGSVTLEQFNSSDLVTSITNGYGMSSATTKTISYNERGEPTAITDGNGHITKYEYNAAGDRTKLITPEGHETKWTYNGTHDVLTVTRPNGEETKITRDEYGDPTVITRPAPKETTQEVKFEYNANGQPTSMTDPLARKWTYGYDTNGDRTSETDPEGDKRTWAYNEDSQQTSTVSPRGNVEGGEPSKYTTSIKRDVQGRPVKVTDQLKHETHYGYDADGNQTSTKDANGHESKTTFNLANEPTKVTGPNGAIVETEYDGAGQVMTQIDGNKHTTKYVRNVLEQVTEIVDPLLRKTTKTYDLAGNLATIKDAANRTTTYTYNKDNQLTKVAYSDGVTPTVEYEYDANGNRTSMTDGTGKTTYTYDQLDRITETKDGHGNVVGYEYDLANEQTKIKYPNGKAVERSYDKAGRLHSVADWLEHTTSFAYDQNTNLTATTFPTGTSEQDTYGYNEADQQTEAKISKGEEILASLMYTHDSNGQVTTTVAKGLPGAETTEYGYDENERLTKANTNKYEYDAANNPTTTPGSTNTFDAGDELTEGTGAKYSYGEVGERTKATPASGPATTYGYNQAGDLTSVARPEEGETPKIEDSYAYNGDGMRVSQTVNGKTSYLALDASEGLPLILNDGTNSYIYDPAGLPVEQIDSEGKVLFLHHDQQGSTRMLTGTSGTVEATMSFDPYGNTTGSTGTATTTLGYDGQYTNSDTGLIDLRARSYDPRTTQFMSEDPATGLTLEPYSYANDNPLNLSDPSGLLFGIPGTPSTSEVVGSIAKGAESVASGTAEGLNTAGEAVNSVAQVAAPVIDGVAAGACVAVAEVCGPALVANFIAQQALAAIQAHYNPNYNLGFNEAAIFAGAGLGTLGAGAVDLAKLRLIGRLALGGSIAAPQWLLNLFQLMSPEEAAAFLGCQ